MCTGRVDLSFPLRAFLKGADGVFVGGCWPGECHYVTEGNYDALGNMYLLKRLMTHIGLDPQRLRLEWIAASEGSRYAELMNDFIRTVADLGPLGQGEGLRAEVVTEGLETVSAMVPQLKLLAREKLNVRVKSEEAYEKLYASEGVARLLDDFLNDPASSYDGLPAYFIDPDKCKACMICLRKCPVEAIDGAKKVIHVIDQERCTHCGTCYYACPAKFGAVRKITDEPIPAPPAEDQRAVVRKARA